MASRTSYDLDSFFQFQLEASEMQIHLSRTLADKIIILQSYRNILESLTHNAIRTLVLCSVGINVAMLAKYSTYHHALPLCRLFGTFLAKLMQHAHLYQISYFSVDFSKLLLKAQAQRHRRHQKSHHH